MKLLSRNVFRFFVLISISIVGIINPPLSQAADLYAFNSFTFTNCSTTGQSGPTTCSSAYSSAAWAGNSSYFSISSGIQRWTAPHTGQYQILAAGAVGVGANAVAGRGAKIQATVTLTQGVSYKILIGQAGANGGGGSGGGGGGTFFADNLNNPIVVAGGGGGALGATLGNASRADGQTTTSGSISSDNTGAAGTNGGGGGGSSGYGGGGGGMTGNGSNAASCSPTLGYSFTNGGTGGGTCSSATGGFGGGAGTHGNTGGGGGGGGYSGGGGSTQGTNANAGGGGSFVTAGATNIATSNGSYAGSTSGISNLNSYNGTAGNSTLSPGFLTITVMDPVTVTISSGNGSSTATYRTVFQILATLSSPGGKVSFYAQNKIIPNCRKLYTATTTVTCNWTPSVKSQTSITVIAYPDSGAPFSPGGSTSFAVIKRVGTR